MSGCVRADKIKDLQAHIYAFLLGAKNIGSIIVAEEAFKKLEWVLDELTILLPHKDEDCSTCSEETFSPYENGITLIQARAQVISDYLAHVTKLDATAHVYELFSLLKALEGKYDS